MKAAIIRKFGSPDVLEYVDNYPEPQLHNNQVLIKVYASGVNPLDFRIRKGELKFITGSRFPMILGNDVCGVIVKCGSDVRNFKVGDEVYGMIDSNKKSSVSGFAKSGAYAEYCVTREDTLSLKPDSITGEEAASFPLCCLTAYQALVYKANIKSGDKILINGASGGVGVHAVQIAKALGANVTAVCSAKNTEEIRKLGADTVIDYKENDISKLNQKFDIIYDVVVTTSYGKCKNIMNKKAVFISNIANPVNMLATYFYPLLKLFGINQRNTFAWVKPSGKDLSIIAAMVDEGKVRPVIEKIYSFNGISEAHKYIESGRVRGKLVIKVQ